MLISEPKHPTCRRLAESIDIGHDSINNFLGRERTKIFKENKIRKILITSIMILLVSIIQAGCMYKLEKKDPYEKGEIITWKLWENMIIKTELGERRIHSSANHTERGEKEFYHPEQEHYLGQFPIDYQPKPFPKLSKEESSVIPFTPILAGKALEFNLMLNGSWVQATDRDVIAQDALDHPDQVKVIINPTNNKWNTKQFFEEQLISDLDISSAKTTNDVTCYKFKGEKGNYNHQRCFGTSTNPIISGFELYIPINQDVPMYAGNIRESIYGGITVTWITDRKNLTQTQKIDAAIWRLLDAWNIAPLAKN